MSPALALFLAPIVVPSEEGMPVERKVEILAQSAAMSAYTQLDLFEEPSVRAELERVGLDEGCPVARQAVGEALATRQEALLPLARTAVRAAIPSARLGAMHPVSLSIAYGGMYQGRVKGQLVGLAADQFAAIHAAAVAHARERLGSLASPRAASDGKPPLPAAVTNGFGADPAQTFEKAPLLSVACLMRAPPPGNFTIESGGTRWPESEHSQ